MINLERKKLHTRFVDPRVEADYIAHANAEYVQKESPVIQAGLVILLVAIAYYIIISDTVPDPLLFYGGSVLLILSLLFGSFYAHLPKPLQSQNVSALSILIASLAPTIWIHNTPLSVSVNDGGSTDEGSTDSGGGGPPAGKGKNK